MSINIGVLATRQIWVGIVEGTTLGEVRTYPESSAEQIDLKSVSGAEMVEHMREMIAELREGRTVESVGAGFPGIVRSGVIEESPNLGQLKGFRASEQLSAALKADGIEAPVTALNDADAIAAGIAATRGSIEKLVRVWYLGEGIGHGHHPRGESVWEAGHSVVTLDPKEHFCGCGGVGHLEGIMGNRAIRLRFLDMEPEEVFAAARQGDARCRQFVTRWHRALAAATATSVHLHGPGRFFITGPNSEYVELPLLNDLLQDMVKMTPLQGSYFEVIPTSHDLALIGAAVSSRIG